MKKRSVLATGLAAGLLAGALCGCGSLSLNLGGQEDRMENYVQGYLDLTYLGQFNDDYMEEMELTQEEAQERYEQGLQVEVEFFEQGVGLFDYPNEETEARLTQLYQEIYSHSDYTVVSSNKLESGNYAVEVTVRPIDIMTKFTPEDFQEVFTQVLSEQGITTQEQLEAMSEADYQELDNVYAQRVMDMVEAELPNVGHGEEESFVVQIQDDGDMWTPVQEDFDAIDMAMIDYSNFGN